jgi:hypothetical protein
MRRERGSVLAPARPEPPVRQARSERAPERVMELARRRSPPAGPGAVESVAAGALGSAASQASTEACRPVFAAPMKAPAPRRANLYRTGGGGGGGGAVAGLSWRCGVGVPHGLAGGTSANGVGAAGAGGAGGIFAAGGNVSWTTGGTGAAAILFGAAGAVSDCTGSDGDQTGIARSVGGSAGHTSGGAGAGAGADVEPQARMAGSVGGSAGQTSSWPAFDADAGSGHAGVSGS